MTRLSATTRKRTGRQLSKELRAEVWFRDGQHCTVCGAHVTLEDAEIHHRQLRSRGGKHAHPNLLTLCTPCHGKVHAFPSWATDEGLQVPSWTTPEEWPVLLGVTRSGRAPYLWQVPDESGQWLLKAPHPDQHAPDDGSAA